jgi:hypothetical protein
VYQAAPSRPLKRTPGRRRLGSSRDSHRNRRRRPNDRPDRRRRFQPPNSQSGRKTRSLRAGRGRRDGALPGGHRANVPSVIGGAEGRVGRQRRRALTGEPPLVYLRSQAQLKPAATETGLQVIVPSYIESARRSASTPATAASWSELGSGRSSLGAATGPLASPRGQAALPAALPIRLMTRSVT